MNTNKILLTRELRVTQSIMDHLDVFLVINDSLYICDLIHTSFKVYPLQGEKGAAVTATWEVVTVIDYIFTTNKKGNNTKELTQN